jgi:hypothetical protein
MRPDSESERELCSEEAFTVETDIRWPESWISGTIPRSRPLTLSDTVSVRIQGIVSPEGHSEISRSPGSY